MCFTGSNWQYAITDWDKGLAPNWRQAFIWATDGVGYWHIYIYVSLGLNELSQKLSIFLYGTQKRARNGCKLQLDVWAQ